MEKTYGYIDDIANGVTGLTDQGNTETIQAIMLEVEE